MLTREQFERASGRTVYGSGGEQIGQVDQLYFDRETREPEWFGIRATSADGKRRLVPVREAQERGDGFTVPYTSREVVATEPVEGDEVSQEAERALYRHYGLKYSEGRSESGLPAGRRESTRPGSRKADRGGSRRSGGDGPTRDELYREAKRLGIEGRSKMNKRELERAVERARGRSGRESDSSAKANPIEVQSFLAGVSYPTRKGDLVREAKRQGASQEVRATLERLPEQRFAEATDVSEAIGKLS